MSVTEINHNHQHFFYFLGSLSRLQHDPLHSSAEAGPLSLLLLPGRPAGAQPGLLSPGEELHLDGRGSAGGQAKEGVEHGLHHRRGLQSHRLALYPFMG